MQLFQQIKKQIKDLKIKNINTCRILKLCISARVKGAKVTLLLADVNVQVFSPPVGGFDKGTTVTETNHRFLPFCAAGTVMTPNYVRSPGISLSPWCNCSSSGNSKPDCDKFSEFFTNNRCLRKFPLCRNRFPFQSCTIPDPVRPD